MPSSSEQLYELDGRKLTYDRYRYELAIRNQTTLEQVNNLAINEGRSVVNVAADFTQQEYGGFLRGVIPQLLDKYGNINATAALSYYEQARRAWTEKQAYNSAGRSSNRQRQQRYAAAVTQGGIRKASITGAEYVAVYADTYDKVAKTDAIVNYAMKVRATSGHGPSVAAMENALTREVAAYHRDTVLFNAGLDRSVSKVQRVAQATACEFCRLMALGSTNGTVRLSDYAIKFHSHCHCTIQTLFEGDQPIRPDYYDKFEAEYVKAKSEFNGTNADFKQTLENWRAINRGKTSPVAVSAPKAVTPSLKKLFDIDNNADLKTAFADVFEAQTYAGFSIKADVSVIQSQGRYIFFRGAIVGPKGYRVGTVERSFYKTENGLEVDHELLDLYDDAKGQGFGTAFSKWSEDWYRENDVKLIKLVAGLQDGAYTWAKAGYVWDSKPNLVYKRLANIVDGEIAIPGVDSEMAKQLNARLNKLAYRMSTLDITDPDYPQPFELANMDGPDIKGERFGRWLLKDTQWHGRKKL